LGGLGRLGSGNGFLGLPRPRFSTSLFSSSGGRGFLGLPLETLIISVEFSIAYKFIVLGE
jgi:hypothetical protein